MSLFELSWLGGSTEKRVHACRPGIDDLPWGTIDVRSIDEATLDEARKVWTNGVFTEYASAAAFSALSTALLQCGAPVDLTLTCADIVVDELFHVTLSSRLLTELGGAVPLEFDLAKIAPSPSGSPLMRAAEIAITTSCVGEALSVPALVRSRALATEPLVRAVLDRLLADEGPHARLGWMFLDWCSEDLGEAERARLAVLAKETIDVYAPLWEDDCGCPDPAGLGGHDAAGRAALRDAVSTKIAKPLSRYGIALGLE